MIRHPRPAPPLDQPRTVELHLMNCDCPRCEPAQPRRSPLVSASTQILAGFAVGQAIVFVLDRLQGGPGPLVVFGL